MRWISAGVTPGASAAAAPVRRGGTRPRAALRRGRSDGHAAPSAPAIASAFQIDRHAPDLVSSSCSSRPQLAQLAVAHVRDRVLGAAARRQPRLARRLHIHAVGQAGHQRQRRIVGRLTSLEQLAAPRSHRPPTSPAARRGDAGAAAASPPRSRAAAPTAIADARQKRARRNSAAASTKRRATVQAARRRFRGHRLRTRAPTGDPRTAATARARRRPAPPPSSRAARAAARGTARTPARCGADDSGSRAFRDVDELLGVQVHGTTIASPPSSFFRFPSA